jgi:hypothetical protein
MVRGFHRGGRSSRATSIDAVETTVVRKKAEYLRVDLGNSYVTMTDPHAFDSASATYRFGASV